MKIRLNKNSDLPIHVQLTEELMYAIAAGEQEFHVLPFGFTLPKTRLGSSLQ
jgi:hypothetical protein